MHLQREEQRRPDIGDAPELHLAGPDIDQRIELAVDGDDFAAAAGFDVLEEEEPLRQRSDDRKLRLGTVDHECTGHAAQHLFGDEAVPVRMVPVEPRLLPAGARDRHLVMEFVSREQMDEDVVASAARRHAHPVEMQVRVPFGQLVAQRHPHDVAEANPPQRRQIGPVVEEPRQARFRRSAAGAGPRSGSFRAPHSGCEFGSALPTAAIPPLRLRLSAATVLGQAPPRGHFDRPTAQRSADHRVCLNRIVLCAPLFRRAVVHRCIE